MSLNPICLDLHWVPLSMFFTSMFSDMLQNIFWELCIHPTNLKKCITVSTKILRNNNHNKCSKLNQVFRMIFEGSCDKTGAMAVENLAFLSQE